MIEFQQHKEAMSTKSTSEVGIGDWDPRNCRPGTVTGIGNLKIWGQGWGQSLRDGDRAGTQNLKVGTGDRDGDSKSKNGDKIEKWGQCGDRDPGELK